MARPTVTHTVSYKNGDMQVDMAIDPKLLALTESEDRVVRGHSRAQLREKFRRLCRYRYDKYAVPVMQFEELAITPIPTQEAPASLVKEGVS